MKLLNQILNKISSAQFNQVYKSLGALNLIASAIKNDEDILSSFCVLAFDEVPNRNFTTKEYINRKADAKNGLNLVQKHLIAKEVSKNLKDASAFYEPELKNYIKIQADFKQPTDTKLVKTAKFGSLAIVDNKYHLVNPITNRVTAEYLVLAADANFAKLHEIIAQYREEYALKLSDLDGQMVLTGAPEVINELEHKIKDETGYYCEAVNEETGVEGEVPEYSLKIFTDITASAQPAVEKQADPDKPLPRTFGYEPLFEGKNLKVEVHVNETTENGKPAGEYNFFDPSTNKVIATQAIMVNNDGYALGEIKFFDGDIHKPLPKTLEENEPTYSKFGIGEDTWADALRAVQEDFGKRYNEASPTQDLSGVQIEKLDATNPNLEKDNPKLDPNDAVEEVVEKTTSKEEDIEKKADEPTEEQPADEAAQAVKQQTGEEVVSAGYDTYGLPTYKSGDEEYAVAADEKQIYEAVVQEVESILDDVGYDAFNWGNMGGIEKYIDTNWFDEERDKSNKFYARDIAEFEPERFKEEAQEYGITVGVGVTDDIIDAFSEKMKENQEENSVEWFINNFGKDAIRDLIKEKKIKFDTHAIADKVINIDGAGHVLSLYDGQEVKQEVNGKTYFLYRQANHNNLIQRKASKTLKSKYNDFSTVDASEEGDYKIYSGDHFIGTCKTIKSAFEELENGGVESAKKEQVEKVAANPFEETRKLTDPIIEMMKPYNDKYQELWKQYNDKQISWEELSNGARQIAQEAQEALQNFHLPEPVEPESSKQEQVEKTADEKIDFEKELMEAGESKGEKEKVNKEQLEMGKEVEKEHTTNPEIAEKITRDHLEEMPDYYTHLKKMEEGVEKKADQELKQFDMKQELDGQKEFEKQDDFSQVSVPEEKVDNSEVTETMEAKPEAPKGESFSASEFGNNMAYIQKNKPEAFQSIMNNLKQIMVGDQQPIYDFLDNWASHNFQDFTAMTREDPTYARHSQYQEQLKNNVLPKLKEMSEYKEAMEEKTKAEKGNVEASVREYDSSDPEDAAVYNHNGEDEGEED